MRPADQIGADLETQQRYGDGSISLAALRAASARLADDVPALLAEVERLTVRRGELSEALAVLGRIQALIDQARRVREADSRVSIEPVTVDANRLEAALKGDL